MKIFDKIRDKNKKELLIKENDKIVVGFSGGPDSVFLVEMLLKLQKEIKFEFVLAHINHQLRGEDALADEEFSLRYGEKKGIKVFSKKFDVEKISKLEKKTLEEVGREVRYRYFSEVLDEIKGNKIALAHNKDDQLENFLFRLMRGTSIQGLRGIESRAEYVRPINEVYKSDILNYLDSKRIAYCIDKTNLENDFTRNSIRLDLIPFIEKRYNNKFKEKLYEFIEELREIDDIFSKKEEKLINTTGISLENLENLTKYEKRRVLVKFLHNYDINVSRKKIELIMDNLDKGGTKEITLNNKYKLVKEYGNIKIELLKTNDISKLEKLKVRIPFDIEYGDYILKGEVLPEVVEKNRKCFYSNLNVGDEVIIRTREDGDRIIPTGMKGTKKVKEIFINEKIPSDMRNNIPIIEYNSEIVWICGIRGSEKFSLKDDKSNVRFTVRRKKDER